MLLSLNPEILKQPYYQANPTSVEKAVLVNEEKILQTPSNMLNLINYFYNPQELDQTILINPKMGVETIDQAKQALKFSQEIISKLENLDSLDHIRQTFLENIKLSGQKNGAILWPLRAALTHEQFSVGAFEAIWVLGKEQTTKRLAQIII